jgi:uncharacterized membrane protein YphA (DoxX/SURF4 family)
MLGRDACWPVARLALAGLLITAAWAKGSDLATDWTWGNRIWQSRPFLIGLVLGELTFALWLLVGLFPRWSWVSAIGLFMTFALFNSYLAITGERSCACFGRAQVDPRLMACVDFLIAAALTVCPLSRPDEPSFASAPWRLYGFVFLAVAVLVPSLLNMVYYAHQGLALDLRRDPRLQGVVNKELRSPSSDELLDLMRQATQLDFTIDQRLRNNPPDYGFWTTGKIWGVMMGMAEKQVLPARWHKTENGYQLALAAPWGSRAAPWLVSGLVFLGACVYLGCVSRRKGSSAVLARFGCGMPV